METSNSETEIQLFGLVMKPVTHTILVPFDASKEEELASDTLIKQIQKISNRIFYVGNSFGWYDAASKRRTLAPQRPIPYRVRIFDTIQNSNCSKDLKVAKVWDWKMHQSLEAAWRNGRKYFEMDQFKGWVCDLLTRTTLDNRRYVVQCIVHHTKDPHLKQLSKG